METPSPLNEVSKMYLIDHLPKGHVWYLWAVKDGHWEAVKSGALETIINKLNEMEGENEQAEKSTVD